MLTVSFSFTEWETEILDLHFLGGASMAYSWQVACLAIVCKSTVWTVYACIKYIKLAGRHWPQTHPIKEEDQRGNRKLQSFRNEWKDKKKYKRSLNIFNDTRDTCVETAGVKSCPDVLSTFVQWDGSSLSDATSCIQLGGELQSAAGEDLTSPLTSHRPFSLVGAFSPGLGSVGCRV